MSNPRLVELAVAAGPDLDIPGKPEYQLPMEQLSPLELPAQAHYSYSTALTFLTAMIKTFIDYIPLCLFWIRDSVKICYATLFPPRKITPASESRVQELLADDATPCFNPGTVP